MRISDWSSDVCSSDLKRPGCANAPAPPSNEGVLFMTNDIHDVAALARPPLSIDVSPIRRGRSGWAVTDDANAEGYGVYIRNPLAHHIADFMLAAWEEFSPARLVEATPAPFVPAAHLQRKS